MPWLRMLTVCVQTVEIWQVKWIEDLLRATTMLTMFMYKWNDDADSVDECYVSNGKHGDNDVADIDDESYDESDIDSDCDDEVIW